jgi:hypothetical protein
VYAAHRREVAADQYRAVSMHLDQHTGYSFNNFSSALAKYKETTTPTLSYVGTTNH